MEKPRTSVGMFPKKKVAVVVVVEMKINYEFLSSSFNPMEKNCPSKN